MKMLAAFIFAYLHTFTIAYSAEVSSASDAPHLYMAGDSIMTEYRPNEWPQYGWGQALKAFMKEPSHLHNFARSGWSARRFRESGRWEKCIVSKLKPSDWVIVSFGHNDSNTKRNKPPKNDYSTPEEYKAFLAGFVADVKAKGANIAFATSIAHSDGFSETDGVMRVDGGVKRLGPYVAAMREAAAKLGVPLLDLNRYAEENLPKMGMKEAKSLYMFVTPGECANYPKGKRDAAHIRDKGAFFYAKGAVEMARKQGLSIADLWKDPASVPFVPTVATASSVQATAFKAVSPDGLNELRLEVGGKGMAYSVWRRGKVLVVPTRFSMAVDGHGWLNGSGTKPKAASRKVEGQLATPLYKKSEINLSANETRVDFGEWAVVLHARNDGVAWRFETKFGGEITVTAANAGVRFPKGTELCYTQEEGFMSGWEKPAKIGPVESVTAGHPQIVMTPFTATVPNAGVVTVTESNLRDYPGLNFYRKENEPDILRSWQAGVPKDVDKGRRKIKVVSREPYLAKTSGTRTFPWRVFVLGDTPSDLVSADTVYALAEPSRVKDASWVKPGQVAWDWWNGFKITDVPGLETGCNFETYKEYVNFAAANGIPYIIMDEGWSEKLNLDKPRAEVNVPGVIAYAKEKGVGVILWAAWSPLFDRETRLRVFDRYAALGATGFKIDFIERDDLIVEKFLEETAADAAERRLVVLYHGIHKPTGLCRTYPNVLNYEGVYGLEQGGRIGGRKVVISNDVNLVYTRMVAGAMDYTPGAMRNRAFDAPPYDKERDIRACYGTRCHQLALFPLFEAPIQMLCDSPTQYRTEPECTAFITKVPTVWDETRGVAGEIGKFASVARRKGRDWWLGAITNWEARDVELPTDFLGGGEWRVEAFEDAPDADTNAEHYVRREFTIKAGDSIKVRLASGGGFAAHFTRKRSVAVCAATGLMPYGKFADGLLSRTRPTGWLGRVCRLQADGLTGHPEALSYPYDTCLWAGTIPRMGTHGQDWWRYEQTAYYTDGLLRLGYALGDKAFIEKGETGVRYTLDNASPEGYLGQPCLWDAENFKLKNGYDMWPLAVFFRAMKAKYDAAPDERIPAALARHFLRYDKDHVSQNRNVVNVEGMLWAYARTGERRLLELAEEAWRMREPLPPEKKNELAPKNCANNDAIHMHGVSYCEEMKVPMLLAAYTGKKEYLDQAVNVERKLVRDHMLPDGCPGSTERVRGNSVHWGHETCDVADYTWSLGYFLETTGDASYADKIERCVFNAGFGAISDDFRALQYFSNPNQFVCTSNSDNNPHCYGKTWMQYRPTHETECCAGNVHRIVPNYISRMWLKDTKGRPVAALYGPSEVDFGWAKVKEETRYPFDGKVVFRFGMNEPRESAFTYRVPGWCKVASVKVNGEAVVAAAPGNFATIERKFADGDVIELDFPMDVVFETLPRRFIVDNKDKSRGLKRPAAAFANSSQGTVVTRGPLVFAYPIPTERTEDAEEHANMNGKKSANPDFKSWNLRPAGPFNYALAAHCAEVVGDGAVGDGFFKNPGAVKLRVSVRRIQLELDENRFTPDLPERPVVLSGEEEAIELVPYGATMLRLGVFPDVSQTRFAATVWRGETAYVDIPAAAKAMAGETADKRVSVTLGYFDEVAYEMQPNGVDERRRGDVYRETPNGKRPTVCKIVVAADAKPGKYEFGPLEVTVVDRVLPPAKKWKYFLDLWQHPWAVSRYFGVEPFSKEHYEKMEPIWRNLAECGCKALTVTLLDLPWNHQCYDGYYSMVGRVKNADGSWTFDYSIFDEYVEFGRRCGLGPDIACYTMCPWKYMVTWKERGTGNGEQGTEYVERREKMLPGTAEFEDYWGPFLVDFAAHMKAKGWFKDSYIAMDERKPEDVKKIVDLIQAKAPGMKVAICGKTKPSAFAGIQIENFCQGLIHLRDNFLPELAPRREKGYKTTFYVCASAKHPNTFFESPRDEGFYLGAYPVMIGFDGFLRWAANSWPEDPYKDGSFRTKDWKAGDTFLIYPGGELSQRLIDLRAGVIAAEKMRMLREAGKGKREEVEGKMAEIAKRYHYFPAVRDPSFDFAGFRREVKALVNGGLHNDH